jgi:hypothetical protein
MVPKNRIVDPSALPDFLQEVGRDASSSFDDALDYFWKTPQFLKQQESIERQKADEYFSDTPWMRDLRWSIESRKIRRVFPYLMAVGNLFTAVAIYELYALELALVLDGRSSARLSAERGQGLERSLKYIRAVGVDPASGPLYSQVTAALKIRNCLMHASGVLTRSRDHREIERIVASREYISANHDRSRERENPMVDIVTTRFGRKLEITNHYAWLATAYLRDHFMDLCLRMPS